MTITALKALEIWMDVFLGGNSDSLAEIITDDSYLFHLTVTPGQEARR